MDDALTLLFALAGILLAVLVALDNGAGQISDLGILAIVAGALALAALFERR